MRRIWVGIDAGKDNHHAAAVDHSGNLLWSRRLPNDQAAIAGAIEAAIASGAEVTWAIDLIGSETGLLRAMLAGTGQQLVYIPGRTVKSMAAGFAGEAKTDVRDAKVIADSARMRADLMPVKPTTDLVASLALLLSHRADLIEDWVRQINRLRRMVSGICPALERALVLTNIGPLTLVAGYPTPDSLRTAGAARLVAYLREYKILHAVTLADRALVAAGQQTVEIPGQDTAAELVSELASGLLNLRQRIKAIDQAIAAVLSQHPQAQVIQSLPGMGAIMTAEFTVAVGDLSTFANPDKLAAYAGLAPMPRDSGKRVGNLQRPRRYNRRLRHVFYMSALTTMRLPGPGRDYYQRKRTEGRRHQQAIIALARRRVNILWALLRDNRPYQPGEHHHYPTG